MNFDSKEIKRFSPLALVTLAACTTNDSGGWSNPITGNVIKGPLSNALVFLDYNDNGRLDTGEPSVRTGTDGSYTLSSSQANVSIVSLTDDSTIDSSSGSVVSGISLANASINISVADVISGFTTGTDLIGLEDRTAADLSWSNVSGGTKVVDTGSNKILFLLEGIDSSAIDGDDFMVTEFV